jgi:hypothetical protein
VGVKVIVGVLVSVGVSVMVGVKVLVEVNVCVGVSVTVEVKVAVQAWAVAVRAVDVWVAASSGVGPHAVRGINRMAKTTNGKYLHIKVTLFWFFVVERR